MDDRRSLVLKAIIESFIASAEPVGSEYLLDEYGFGVSSATIRNDMAWLEKEGFICQPHTSAGRIPTDDGFRKFVNDMEAAHVDVTLPAAVEHQFKKLEELLARDTRARIEEKLYSAVSALARMTNNIAFATLPWRGTAYYLGLANVLKSPEFAHDAVRASAVIEILEDSEHFIEFVQSLGVGPNVSIYIGKENLLKAMETCSLVATTYTVTSEHAGIIGILGPKRMHYGLNIAALNAVRGDIV